MQEKSLLAAGLCRIFKQGWLIGWHRLSHKTWHLNSFITKDGFEMGRAQVVQAKSSRDRAIRLYESNFIKASK